MTVFISLFLLAPAPAPAPTPTSGPAAPSNVSAAASSASVSHPLRLAVSSTSAFGVTHAKFFNQLVGARVDYRFTSRFAFGAALAYANLKGKDGRVQQILPEVLSQYRAPLRGESFGLPLRLALGYLPRNGPTLRLATGVDFALSNVVTLELVPLEPMIWITRERPEVSLDASIALAVAF